MKEGPSDKPPFKVIEGGNKELRELPKKQEVSNPWRANIEKVRKLSPSLDFYLSHRPDDKDERTSVLQKISDELSKLPTGSNPYEVYNKRTIDKFGNRPPHARGAFTWRDRTEEQVAWEEKQALEHANLIGERMTAMADQQRKIGTMEDFLTDATERHYAEEEKKPADEEST